ncbi:class I SAM-dependent methyltransferase [bacterium]|nr:class I SAM-dependent methyltransferase [bacterium]
MKHIACPVCRADNRDAFMRGGDLLHGVDGAFTLVRCACGMVYLNPMPDNAELARYYPDDYCPHRERKMDPSLKKHRAWKVFILRWYYGCPVDGPAPPRFLRLLARPVLFWLSLSTLKSMIPYHGAGRIVDVGCGNGGWLLRLKNCGWDVHGVEIDGPAAAAAGAAGVPCVRGTLHDAHFADGSFDVVRLHYVFEHLVNPGETLDEIRRILKPGGRCYIRIPNIDSLTFRLFGRHWFPLDIPRHVFHYTPRTFMRLAGQHGLAVTRVHAHSPPSGFFTSLDYARRAGAVPRWLAWVREDCAFCRNLWRPAGWLVDRCGKGDIVEYTLTPAATAFDISGTK